MKILGIPYGRKEYVNDFWKNIVKDLRSTISDYNNVYSTFDAKSVITKSLILPKVSYAATVVDIPGDIRKSIDTFILKYIIPKGKTYLDLFDLAQKRKFGGYNIDHTTIHAMVFSLIPIFKYVNSIIENIPLTKEQFFIEYNLGIHLANILNVPVNNRTPHRLTPMKPYARILKFLREMNMSKEDLINGKVKSVYEKIIFSKNKVHDNFPKWSRLHCEILPNYLKTFNYKASVDILPCKTNFVEFGLDTDSRCNFCRLHADTVPHMFCNCSVVMPIWNILDRILKCLNYTFRFTESRRVCNFNLIGSRIKKSEEIIVIYLNTIANHKIWKFSMKIQYENFVFHHKEFFKSLIKTIEGRKKMELSDRMRHSQKICRLDDLSTAVKQVVFTEYGIR